MNFNFLKVLVPQMNRQISGFTMVPHLYPSETPKYPNLKYVCHGKQMKLNLSGGSYHSNFDLVGLYSLQRSDIGHWWGMRWGIGYAVLCYAKTHICHFCCHVCRYLLYLSKCLPYLPTCLPRLPYLLSSLLCLPYLLLLKYKHGKFLIFLSDLTYFLLYLLN